ncbi:8385_t:CDS:2, partial [Paraglomus brasilianum]
KSQQATSISKVESKLSPKSMIQKHFKGWKNSLDPQNFNLLTILKFCQGKDDFMFDKSTEHTFISKFVSHLAKTSDGDWRRAASLLDSAILKVRGNPSQHQEQLVHSQPPMTCIATFQYQKVILLSYLQWQANCEDVKLFWQTTESEQIDADIHLMGKKME